MYAGVTSAKSQIEPLSVVYAAEQESNVVPLECGKSGFVDVQCADGVFIRQDFGEFAAKTSRSSGDQDC